MPSMLAKIYICREPNQFVCHSLAPQSQRVCKIGLSCTSDKVCYFLTIIRYHMFIHCTCTLVILYVINLSSNGNIKTYYIINCAVLIFIYFVIKSWLLFGMSVHNLSVSPIRNSAYISTLKLSSNTGMTLYFPNILIILT